MTQRRLMVESQIRGRGVLDASVLDAMSRIPREHFLAEELRHAAYEDKALPIAHRQTISQPFIVAYMTEQLQLTPESKVLEIGTGSGYQTAILSLLAGHVYSVERVAALLDEAKTKLAELHLTNITFSQGDGSLGWPHHAPFDRIIVTAASPRVPQPLVDQLVDGGVMVVPVGGAEDQNIVRVLRRGNQTIESPLLACRFVKLIGESAWSEP